MATTVEVIMKMVGAEPNGKGKSGDDPTEPKPPEQKGFLRKFAGGIRKLTGIQFSTAAMLKQSQIFTSTVGVIFQLMGALVDVILAPFIPIIVPAIQWIAKSIPIVSKIAQWIANALKGIANWLIAIWNDPIKTIKDSLSYIGDNIVGWIKSALNPFNFDTKWGVFAIDFAKILAYFPRIGGYILDLIPNILKGAWYAIRLLTKVFFPHVYTAFRIFNIMLNKYIKPMFGFLGKALGWISTNFSPRKILSEANKFIQNILKGLYTKAGNALANIKFLGKLSGRLLKLGAIGSKGIPVVGAVATAGFGTYEAYQAGRKMAGEDGGFNWGVASQYMAKTAVATTLTGLGYSPAGLAVDLAGTAALNRYHGGSFLTLEVDSGDGTTTSVEMYETAVANSRARIRLNVVSEGG